MTTWALIPCSKTKADRPCSAREMYWPSAQFRGAYSVAESNRELLLILSAKYGLLFPEMIIDPYDETLIGKSRAERSAWAMCVVWKFQQEILRPGDIFVSYLGAVYAEFVVPALRERGHDVTEPLKGLGQGKRLRWFKEQLLGRESA